MGDGPVRSGHPARAWGLVTRRPRWGLSARGWAFLLLAAALIGWFVFRHAFTFLAVREPVKSDVLVVEGWMDNWAFPYAAKEFERGKYRLLLSTGGPVVGSGGYTNEFNTVASVGAERLIAAGIPRDRVRVVASRESARDRTYSSATALKRWLAENGQEVHAINVMTQSTHARRTRMLFQLALGDGIKVGIIPILNPDFDPQEWWQHSQGVRDVIDEVIAFLYAQIFVLAGAMVWPDPARALA